MRRTILRVPTEINNQRISLRKRLALHINIQVSHIGNYVRWEEGGRAIDFGVTEIKAGVNRMSPGPVKSNVGPITTGGEVDDELMVRHNHKVIGSPSTIRGRNSTVQFPI
jgi:hypothetical protein